MEKQIRHDLKVSGVGNASGGIFDNLTIEGTAEITGGFRAEEAEIRGTLRVKGDCQAEVIVLKGAFTIGGLLNAGSIDIMLYGNCTARQIGGEKINIRKDRSSRLIRFIESIFPNTDDLTTESVEGDDIYLEYTKAKVVRGNNVNIGPGCEIELVEYGNDFQQMKEATVKDSKRII